MEYNQAPEALAADICSSASSSDDGKPWTGPCEFPIDRMFPHLFPYETVGGSINIPVVSSAPTGTENASSIPTAPSLVQSSNSSNGGDVGGAPNARTGAVDSHAIPEESSVSGRGPTARSLTGTITHSIPESSVPSALMGVEKLNKEIPSADDCCKKCGTQTHHVSLMGPHPLTTDDVHHGICIPCNPSSVPRSVLREWKEQQQKQTCHVLQYDDDDDKPTEGMTMLVECCALCGTTWTQWFSREMLLQGGFSPAPSGSFYEGHCIKCGPTKITVLQRLDLGGPDNVSCTGKDRAPTGNQKQSPHVGDMAEERVHLPKPHDKAQSCWCSTCGVQTRKKNILGLLTRPLTNDNVYHGRCVRCQPNDVPLGVLQKWQYRNLIIGPTTTIYNELGFMATGKIMDTAVPQTLMTDSKPMAGRKRPRGALVDITGLSCRRAPKSLPLSPGVTGDNDTSKKKSLKKTNPQDEKGNTSDSGPSSASNMVSGTTSAANVGVDRATHNPQTVLQSPRIARGVSRVMTEEEFKAIMRMAAQARRRQRDAMDPLPLQPSVASPSLKSPFVRDAFEVGSLRFFRSAPKSKGGEVRRPAAVSVQREDSRSGLNRTKFDTAMSAKNLDPFYWRRLQNPQTARPSGPLPQGMQFVPPKPPLPGSFSAHGEENLVEAAPEAQATLQAQAAQPSDRLPHAGAFHAMPGEWPVPCRTDYGLTVATPEAEATPEATAEATPEATAEATPVFDSVEATTEAVLTPVATPVNIQYAVPALVKPERIRRGYCRSCGVVKTHKKKFLGAILVPLTNDEVDVGRCKSCAAHQEEVRRIRQMNAHQEEVRRIRQMNEDRNTCSSALTATVSAVSSSAGVAPLPASTTLVGGNTASLSAGSVPLNEILALGHRLSFPRTRQEEMFTNQPFGHRERERARQRRINAMRFDFADDFKVGGQIMLA